MHLVNAERPIQRRHAAATCEPVAVGPFVTALVNDRCITRRWFMIVGKRIALERQQIAVAVEQLVLVLVARSDAGNEELPDPVARMQTHHVAPPVPVVEAADDADARGIRRPDGKPCPPHAVEGSHLGTELLVDVLVGALAEQVEVQVAQRLCKPIRVLDDVFDTVHRRNTQAIMAFARRHHGHKQPAPVHPFHLRQPFPAGVDQLDPRGMRLKGPDYAGLARSV